MNKPRIVSATDQAIEDGAALLRRGGLVSFPTETVYGLGANARDGQAVARIFAAKERPQFNPLIVHVQDTDHAASLVEMDERARILADAFWPGPLTLILPHKTGSGISDLCTAGLPTLAVRVPAQKVAQQLLRVSGLSLAAPSANRSGMLSPTTPAHVAESLGDKVDMILAAGSTNVGLESTVLDLTEDTPVILRPGSVTQENLADTLESHIETLSHVTNKPTAPGQTLKHYAPSTPLRLNAVDVRPGEALLAFGSDRFMSLTEGGAARDLPDPMRRNLSETGDLHEAAANLFRMLHELDRPEHKAIAVMAIPARGLGIAINDRLKRATDTEA